MTKPKSVGRLPLTSFQLSPASSRAHHVPVLLHEEHARTLRVHGDVVHAVADFGVLVGNVLRAQSAVDRLPAGAAVVGAERARRRDGNVHPLRIAGIENDGVQAHAARARLPLGAGAVAAQAGEFLPVLPPSVERKMAASSTPA